MRRYASWPETYACVRVNTLFKFSVRTLSNASSGKSTKLSPHVAPALLTNTSKSKSEYQTTHRLSKFYIWSTCGLLSLIALALSVSLHPISEGLQVMKCTFQGLWYSIQLLLSRMPLRSDQRCTLWPLLKQSPISNVWCYSETLYLLSFANIQQQSSRQYLESHQLLKRPIHRLTIISSNFDRWGTLFSTLNKFL